MKGHITVRMPQGDVDAITKMCKARGISRSEWLRDLMRTTLIAERDSMRVELERLRGALGIIEENQNDEHPQAP